MAELRYSAEAINVLSKFHRCDLIVYVEGDDDELFWSVVFKKCSDKKILPQSVGGAPELDKHITRIIADNLRVLAARDADFLVCCDQHISDPRVIYTYGYSIENTLYTEAAVAQIARLWSKGKGQGTEAETKKWLENFHNAIEELTLYDAANFLHDCGLLVSGENIARFACRDAPHEIDVIKVEKHLVHLASSISAEMRALAAALRIETGRTTPDNVRGHFLASAVLQFVLSHARSAGMNAKISYDGLYAVAIQCLESALDKTHPHYDYYCAATRTAVAAL
jgi:hypothetical protein